MAVMTVLRLAVTMAAHSADLTAGNWVASTADPTAGLKVAPSDLK